MQHFDLRSALFHETGLGKMTNANEYIDSILLVIKDLFFRIDTRKFEGFRLDNIVSSEGLLTFTWISNTEEAVCPRCGAVSEKHRHTYKTRVLIDEPILGMMVMHNIRLSVYICNDCIEAGDSQSFVEPISSICRGSHIKTTINLDEKIVNDAIYQSANSLSNNYSGTINVSAGTILNRLKEAGGIVTEDNLTKTKGVKILSVDDNNGRKGAPSSANTVVVDIERHIILVVAQGADSTTAKRIFDRFPEAETVSRDRDCAYSKAANDCNLDQVADIFHIVVNAHAAAKEALAKGMDYNIYLKQGDGWNDLTADGVIPELSSTDDSVTAGTLSDDDITLRVQLASLSPKQEMKYRRVIELLKLQDLGFGSKEINNRLGITTTVRIGLYGDAADVVNNVETRIDEYYARKGGSKFRQKFMSSNARPSHESIVEPYSDTVMKMAEEGLNHRKIHPVIKEMGYTGSLNTVYQYILKKRAESGIDYISDTADDTTMPEGVPQRPPRISLQRVTRTAVYKFVLHEASEKREKANMTAETAPTPSEIKSAPAKESTTPTKVTSPFYSEMVTEIIYGKEKEAQDVKKNKARLQGNSR